MLHWEQAGSNGLSFNRARFYHPATCGWLSLDPFEGVMDRPLSLNGYAYVEGQVVNATDASGRCIDGHIVWHLTRFC
jgi:RHS repeat-associated protein